MCSYPKDAFYNLPSRLYPYLISSKSQSKSFNYNFLKIFRLNAPYITFVLLLNSSVVVLNHIFRLLSEDIHLLPGSLEFVCRIGAKSILELGSGGK